MGTVFTRVGRGTYGRPVPVGKRLGGVAVMMLLCWQCNGMAQHGTPQRVPAPSTPVAVPAPKAADASTVSDAAQGDWKQQSAQLLLLATELKKEVDKTTENILSVTVIEKARQIERFTHATEQQLKAAN